MKSSIIIPLLLLTLMLQAQRQMDIQGDPLSSDTVASIKVNFQGPKEVVGLSVFAQPNMQQGIGGYFFGGNKGLEGHSNSGTGIIGRSGSGLGLYGLSSSASGVFGESTSGYGVKGQSIHSNGIYGRSTESAGVYGLSDLNVGVFGVGPAHVGVRGQSDTGIGVQGLSQTGKGVRGESTRIGVLGTSISTPIAIFVDGRVGVVGYSDDTLGISGISAGSPGIGVQGLAQGYGGRGIVGLGPDSVSTGVWAAGSAFDFVAGGPGMDYGSTSSQRWKKNVKTIQSPLELINSLRGVSFDWDEAHGGRHDIGFIAEEVGKVLPEIVSYEENGIDATGMDYSRLTSLLVEAVKALNEKVNILKRERRILIKENEQVKIDISELNERLNHIEHKLAKLPPKKSEEKSSE